MNAKFCKAARRSVRELTDTTIEATYEFDGKIVSISDTNHKERPRHMERTCGRLIYKQVKQAHRLAQKAGAA